MGLSAYYKSSLYSIPEEEPEEKKPTRAPYKGRKSMFCERPVEVKKIISVSQPVMEGLKKTHETESTCSGINLKKECDIKKEYFNNDCNIPDPKPAEMSPEHLSSFGIKTEKTLKDFQSVNQMPGSEMRKQDLNHSYNLPDQKTAQMFEVSSPFSTQTENPTMNVPYQKAAQMFEVSSPFSTQTEKPTMNVPYQKAAQMFEVSSPFSTQTENPTMNFPCQKTAQMFEVSSPFSTQTENPTMNFPYQKTAQVYEYLSPFNVQTQNTPMNIPNVNLKSGSDPLFCSQACPDNGYYFAPPSNNASTLYYEPCDFLQQMNFVNFSAPPSTDPYCADLPFLELRTLQFFYNLGWEYFHAVNNFINYGYIQPVISEQIPDFIPEFKNPEQNQNYIPRYKKRNYNNSGYSYRTNFGNQREFKKYGSNGRSARKKNVNKNNAWNGGQRKFNRSFNYFG